MAISLRQGIPMSDYVKLGACLWMLIYVVGCCSKNEAVYLSVNVRPPLYGHVDGKDVSVEDGELNIYFNGNLFRSLRHGFIVSPVDKYLKPGGNVVEIRGTAMAPISVRLVSYESDHKTMARLILDDKVLPVANNVGWSKAFRVCKMKRMPIFEKNYQLPPCRQAEQDIAAIVTNMYQAVILENWDEFCRIALEGYTLHNPAAYQAVMADVKTMMQTFQPQPFPDKLQFIHGSNLVCVYSRVIGGKKILFESEKTNSCNVGSVDFAYINGRWIVW